MSSNVNINDPLDIKLPGGNMAHPNPNKASAAAGAKSGGKISRVTKVNAGKKGITGPKYGGSKGAIAHLGKGAKPSC